MCETRVRKENVTRFLVVALAIVGVWVPRASAGGSSGTATALAVSAGSVTAGTVSTLTSTTTFAVGGAPVPRGLVTFCSSTGAQCDGAAVFGVAQVTSNGTATIKLRLGVGSYNIKAVFAAQPTANITGSSSSAQSVTVTGAANYATSSTIGATGSVGNYKLVGTVTAFGKPTTTGTVSFLDTSNSNAAVATATLDPATLGRIFVPAAGSPLTGQQSVQYVAAGDFNNDGIPDLAVANINFTGTVAIYLGNGDGTFQTATTYNAGGFPRSLTLADVNGDGKLDLIVPTQNNASVGVLLGNGDGTFGAVASFATGASPSFVAVGDFNGDGIPDVAVTNESDNNVSVLLGNGDGTFQTQAAYGVGANPVGVVAGDFNNDGRLDLAVSAGSGISLLIGNGNGTFQTAVSVAVPNFAGDAFLTAGDLRANGTLDLVYPDSGSATVYVLLGNNDGTFQTGVAYAIGDVPQAASLGDINGDGILDIVVADTGADGLVSVLLGNGDGTFAVKTDYNVGNNPENVALADYNGDGLLDLSTGNLGGDNTTILLQQLVETATATGVSVSGNSAPHPVLASYPGDAAHSASMSTTTPLIGTAQTTTSTTLGVSPNPATFGQAVTMTATISPTPTGTPFGTVSFFSGTTLLGSGTVNAAGVATFSTSALSAGVNSITAVYSGNAAFGGSTSAALFENVHATTATTTTLTVSAGTVTAGTATTLTALVAGACSPVASGSVIFCDASAAQCSGLAILGTVQLKSDGTAILKRTLGVGTYSIKAVFQGRSDLVGSSSPAQSLTVNGNGLYPSVTTLSDAGVVGNYSLFGSVAAFGTKPLTGNLTFLDTSNGSAVVATAALDGANPNYVLAPAAGSPLAGTDGPEDVASGDFNGDGILDLAVVNDSSPLLTIYLGNGDGTFQAAVNYPLGNYGAGIAVGDFNGDGKLDLVVTSPGEFDTFSIFLGNGDGTFQDEAVSSAGGAIPVGVVVGDFNNDGVQDLAIADIENGLAIFLGKGDGTFNSPTVYASNNGPVYLASGDFNGDGILDVAVAELAGDISVYLGNGDGTFQTPVLYQSGANPDYVVALDLNKDGKLDLVAANAGDSSMSVFLGNGDGTFQSQVVYPTGNGPEEFAVGDFNHDGKADLAATDNSDTTISIMYGNGDGTFQAPILYDTTGAFPYSIIAGDFNGDGLTDLVETSNGPNTVNVLLGQQVALATASEVSVNGAGEHDVLASYPGDASRLASESATVPLMGNPPTATTVTLTVSPNPVVVGQSVTFTATIAPAPTGTPLGTVSFCSSAVGPVIIKISGAARGAGKGRVRGNSSPAEQSGPCGAGTLLGTGTVSALGVATFTSSALTVGTVSVTAVYSGNLTFAASTSTAVNEVINPLAATTTTLAISPNPAAAGQPVTLTATIAPTPTGSPLGTVSFFSGDALLGMGTVSASGVATLTTTSLAFGSDTITAVYSGNVLFATSTSSGATAVITAGFTVNSAQSSFAVAEGGAVVIPLTVPPLGGPFTSVVTMSATGLPPGATGTFSPPTVTPGATGAATTLTIQLKTLTVSGLPVPPIAPRNFAVMGLGVLLTLAGALLSFLRRGWKLPKLAQLALAGITFAGVVLLFAGCNGGFAGTPITPKGSYPVTITGTSGELHPSTTVTVVVQ